MCGRALIVPKEVVDQIVQDIIRKRVAEYLPDWPAVRRSIYPSDVASLIVPQGGSLASKEMQWGFEVSWSKRPLFNTKVETAMRTDDSNMWRDSLLNRRCVLPTFGFFESHDTETYLNPQTNRSNKQQYLFTTPNSPYTFLAGIYQDDRFSLMTTEPNASVKPVHDRMPVVLVQQELDIWFNGDFTSLFDRSALALKVEKEPVPQHEGATGQKRTSGLELPGQESLL